MSLLTTLHGTVNTIAIFFLNSFGALQIVLYVYVVFVSCGMLLITSYQWSIIKEIVVEIGKSSKLKAGTSV
jgi:hypothetical protein